MLPTVNSAPSPAIPPPVPAVHERDRHQTARTFGRAGHLRVARVEQCQRPTRWPVAVGQSCHGPGPAPTAPRGRVSRRTSGRPRKVVPPDPITAKAAGVSIATTAHQIVVVPPVPGNKVDGVAFGVAGDHAAGACDAGFDALTRVSVAPRWSEMVPEWGGWVRVKGSRAQVV